MKTSSLLLRLSLVAATLGVLTACPKVPDADPLAAPPRVLTFTTSAKEVPRGDRVTLTWTTENATSIKIEDVRFGAISGVSGTSGSVETAISDETLFVLTVRNDRGASDTAVVVVHVAAEANQELLFSALPTLIKAGETATLAWSAPGASSVTLTANPGGAVDVGTQTSAGAVLVSPVVDTTYTLSANGKTATAQVRVRPTLLSFDASPLSADAGATVTLSWNTANATRVQLLAPGRGTLVDEMDAARVAQGSFDDTLPTQVDPGQTFPYQLVVTGAGTTLTSDVIVSLNGSPAILTFTAPDAVRDPALPLADGGVADAGTIHLAWTTRETAELSLSANGVSFFLAPPAAIATGSLDLPTPATDTTYVLTARAATGGTVTKSKAVEVRGLPTVQLTATPSTINATQTSSLAWTGTFLHGATLSNPIDGVIYASADAGVGSVTVSPNDTTAYTVRVGNGVGDFATASASVTVNNPILLSVTDTGTLRRGQDISLAWTAPMPSTAMIGLPHKGVDARAIAFDDISATGTALDINNVDFGEITTSFRTTLYGRRLGDRITVSYYGYLVFGDVNGYASSNVAPPTAYIEPLAIAPYWESLTINEAYWQVKTVSGVQWLIVQWEATDASFQARVSELGQVDFDYRKLPTTIAGNTLVTGPRADTFVTGTPVPDAGLTFFGPRTSPVTLPAMDEGRISGALDLGNGSFTRLSTVVSNVVFPTEFFVSEVMSKSAATNGNFVEVSNRRSTPLDLTGWNLTFPDGGTVALSGTVPANGQLVLGSSTDSSLNDDAGVTVALSNFDLTGVTSLTFGRGGAQSTVALAGDAGISVVREVGTIRTSGSVTLPATCYETRSYGVLGQLGSPGSNPGCGFPYALTPVPYGFFDISTTGTKQSLTDYDSSIVTVALTAAPVPFFGTPRTSVQVTTNGYMTFQTATGSGTNAMSSAYPSTTDDNSVAAVFGDDLDTDDVQPTAIYVQRVGANVDPAAAAPHWVIQWSHFTHWLYNDDLNFQAKLFDDGVIEYHYAKLVSTSSTAYGSGASANSWLENEGGTQALVINAGTSNPGISPFTAFRFTPR